MNCIIAGINAFFLRIGWSNQAEGGSIHMTTLFFAAANTGNGYEHFLQDLPIRGQQARVCLIKGDAQALLLKIAEAWQAQGRDITCYTGAGDEPIALISGDWAAVDATAPHALPPLAGDLIIDLRQALDESALRPWRGEAAALGRRISALNARAWRCLHAARTAQKDSAAIYAEAADEGALCNLRLELMQWMQGERGPAQRGFAQAVTADGVISHADALARRSTLCLDLPFGLEADALLYPVAVALSARGTGYQAGMHMLDGGLLTQLCTDSHAIVSHVIPSCPVRTLRLNEGVLRREREALAFNRAAYNLWLGRAVETLAAARDARAQLRRLTADAVRPERQEALEAEALAFFI